MKTSNPIFDIGGGEPLEASGWDAIEGNALERIQEREFQDQVDHASMYRQAFTSEAGRYVLQELINAYLVRRIIEPEQQNPTADAVRQGQQDVVIRILQLIEFANTGGGRPPNPSE